VPDDLQGPIEAALVVLVPEVEPLVAPFRLEHDPSAVKGVPAHITINYPFLPAIDSDEDLQRELSELFSKAQAFQFTFNHFARFPDVLYLAPEPVAPFKRLIDLVAARFPESPPYEGAFEELIPHLTVAQTQDERILALLERELEALAREYLPLSIRVEQVTRMDNRAGRWHQVSSYPLSGDNKRLGNS